MFQLSLRRVLVYVILAAGFFTIMQFVPLYFYASEFVDFVKDEVRFAPTRESVEDEHLITHIINASHQYGVNVDPKDIVIRKTHQSDPDIHTLSVDVAYSAPIDLYYTSKTLQFHVH